MPKYLNMIKAVIFDLDGVIVDTAKYHFIAWNEIAKQFGFEITILQNEQLKGVSRDKSLDIILGWGNITMDNPQKEVLLVKKNAHYLKYIDTLNKTDILPGIMAVLSFLKTHKIAIALGSASKNALPILEKLEIAHLFDAIIDGNVVKKAKPHPEVFLKAAHSLNIAPEFCVVIEDAKAGIKAANSAQMTSIGIGKKSILGQADYVLEDTSKLSKNFLSTLLKI